MSTPEVDVLDRLLDRLDQLERSVQGDLALMGERPSDLAAFNAMSPQRQSASRAALKSFEQIEDQLSRAFRAIPRLMGDDTRRWFARDFADYMERFGILDRAADRSKVVRLRNQLVHDYPLDPAVQFGRVMEAIGYLPLLQETHRRFAVFAHNELAGKRL